MRLARPAVVRFAIVTAAAGLAALGLVACGDDSSKNAGATSSTATEATSAATTSKAPASEDAAAPEAAQAALRTAAGAVPNGQPFDLEIETASGQKQFEVKVASDGAEFKVVVDSEGHKVISQQQADHPDDDVAKLDGTQVTAAQALQTASGREADAQLKEVEIDTDPAGAVVWKVELVRPDSSEIEYTIDAHSGEVVSPK